MGTEKVRDGIFQFLKTPEKGMIVVTGRWGVGKTHCWTNSFRAAAKQPKGVSFERYSYVSLFGVSNLDAIRDRIVEQTLTRKDFSKNPDIKTLTEMLSTERILQKWMQWLPGQNNWSQVARRMAFLSVRQQVVCFDDLERRAGIELKQILGLANFLVEDRDCKVVFLVNDDALAEDREEFQRQLEKLTRAVYLYNPEPSECVAAADLGDDAIARIVSECSVAVGIRNIRIIKRVRTYADALPRALESYPEVILREAVSLLTLLTWAYFKSEDAPPIRLIDEEQFGGANETQEFDEAWGPCLDACNIQKVDTLAIHLLNGIKNGYFDESAILEIADARRERLAFEEKNSKFSQAWRRFHDSFDDDAALVLDEMYEGFMGFKEEISIENFDATYRLFKELGDPQRAHQMLQAYMAIPRSSRRFFDLSEQLFGNQVVDPEVQGAFEEKLKSYVDVRSVGELIDKASFGLDSEDMLSLSNADVSDFVSKFEKLKGDQLRETIGALLRFSQVSSGTRNMAIVAAKTRSALQALGSRSPINRRRVAKFGIKIIEAE